MNIYEKHRAAFSRVSPYVIVRDGKQVGTIAFKFPKDGADIGGRSWYGTLRSAGYEVWSAV